MIDLVLLVDFLLPVTLKDNRKSASLTRAGNTERHPGTERNTGLGSGSRMPAEWRVTPTSHFSPRQGSSLGKQASALADLLSSQETMRNPLIKTGGEFGVDNQSPTHPSTY